MKLKKVLHPEIVALKRGPEEMLSNSALLYKEVRFENKFMHVDPDGFLAKSGLQDTLFGIGSDYINNHGDPMFVRYLANIQDWRRGNFKTYYVGKDFTKTLSEVDLKIPVDVLPENFFAYVAFGEGSISDEEFEVGGAYVRICKAKDMPIRMNVPDQEALAVWICYTDASMQGRIVDLFVLLENKSLEELIDEHCLVTRDMRHVNGEYKSINYTEDTKIKRAKVFRTALNAVIYIHSADAILHKTLPEDALPKRKVTELRATGSTNLCTIPVILLNEHYHEPKQFHVEGTWVRSHPRWQPCGAGRTQVKLIWVKEHERKYV